MKRHAMALATAATAALAGCGGADRETGLTNAEDRQLDEAAAALDEAQAEYEAALQTPPEPAESTETAEEH